MTRPMGALIAQLVKQYAHHRVVDIERHVMHGAEAAVAAVLRRTQGATTAVTNTAHLKRLDATFCARLASLTRRTRAGVHQKDTLDAGMWLVGTTCPFVKLAPGLKAGARDVRWRELTEGLDCGRVRCPVLPRLKGAGRWL